MSSLPRRRYGLLGAALAAGLAVSSVLGGLLSAVAVAQSAVAPNITFFRQAGQDRYGTAAAIAGETFGANAPTVLLATGADFPDALAGAYLAGTQPGGAPILLTDPASLSSETSAALVALHTQRVVILGGPGAVSDAVQSQLDGHYQVSRIGGTSRYGTAQLLDTQPGSPVGTDSAGQPTAIVVNGLNFPDAVSAGGLGYARHLPIVLTDPHRLSPEATAVLSADHIGHVIQVGGSAAIDPSVTQAIQAMGITVDEVAGTDRSATSAALAADEVAHYGFSSAHMDLATGAEFADALAGGPHSGAETAPLLLSGGGNDPGSAASYAGAHCSTMTSGDALGGTQALPDATVQAVGVACPSNASVKLSTSPTTLAADGTTTAVLTADVLVCGPPGSAIACGVGSGQAVDFTSFPSHPGACGTVAPATATTDSTGQATATYTASTTSGTCVVTASANGYSASVAITQTSTGASTAPAVALAASPTTLPADGASTSTVTATVDQCPPPGYGIACRPLVGQSVVFTTSPSVPGACGTLAPATATTDSSGQATATYTASTTSGTCVVTATSDGESGTTTITQV